MLLGIDLGNSGIKTSEGVYIPSRITTEDKILHDGIEIIFNGQKYIVGIGDYQTEYDKTAKESILPFLFASIAKSTTDIANEVVLGLPAAHYKKNGEKLKNIVLDNRMTKLIVNGIERNLIISDMLVAPEGVGAYYSMNNEQKNLVKDQDLIIIDIGGRTTDIIFFPLSGRKRAIENSRTIPTGMLNIYSDFINEIESIYALGKTIEDAETIMKKGLYIDGEKIDLNFTKDVMKKHFDKIIKELNINYPVRTAPLLVTGGGGEVLFNSIKKRFPTAILMDNSLFANAIGFKEMGARKWH